MSVLAPIDTLSDRRDLWALLHRLHPCRRLHFLNWACLKASRPNMPCPTPEPGMGSWMKDAIRCGRGDDRFTNMVYADLVAISAEYDFDIGRAMLALEDYVRGKELPPVPKIAAAGMVEKPWTGLI